MIRGGQQSKTSECRETTDAVTATAAAAVAIGNNEPSSPRLVLLGVWPLYSEAFSALTVSRRFRNSLAEDISSQDCSLIAIAFVFQGGLTNIVKAFMTHS